MYVRYARSKGYSINLQETKDGFVSFIIQGKSCYSVFQSESGKHVVQRIPSTERHGRAQTSVVTVAVMPITDVYRNVFKDSEFEIKTQTGSGPGGQHQNKTESAVRMKHIPTGLSVFIIGRSQGQNKSTARKILETKVKLHYESKISETRSNMKSSQVGDGGRSGKIRTYNFMDSRCVCHKTGKKTTQLKEIMKGNLDLIKS